MDVEVDDQAHGGLLLYYNPECYIGLALDSSGISFHKHGHRSPAGEGSRFDGRRATLRITNHYHDVNLAFRVPDGEWKVLDTTYETSGYHHNVFGGFLDLRMALCACGQGEARFRKLDYRELG